MRKPFFFSAFITRARGPKIRSIGDVEIKFCCDAGDKKEEVLAEAKKIAEEMAELLQGTVVKLEPKQSHGTNWIDNFMVDAWIP